LVLVLVLVIVIVMVLTLVLIIVDVRFPELILLDVSVFFFFLNELGKYLFKSFLNNVIDSLQFLTEHQILVSSTFVANISFPGASTITFVARNIGKLYCWFFVGMFGSILVGIVQ